MNSAVAIITTIIVTNWVSIGTFTDNFQQRFDVKQGTRFTNTVAEIQYEGTNHQFVLKSIEGPIVGEVKESRIMWVTNWFSTNLVFQIQTDISKK